VVLSRRHLIAGIGTVATVGPAFFGGTRRASAQDVNAAELLKPGPLGDKVLGADNAPVTIVEYASVTCPHCATFHQQTYPTLKSKYIDTGKVRLIFREFPTQPAPVAIAGFMLARCAGDRYYPMLDAIFDQQKTTPTFFINGKRYVGGMSPAELEKILEPLLKSS
jgi:protein-disulfide isomerase